MVEWPIFAGFAFIMLASGYKATDDIQDKMLLFSGSFLFWLATMYQWVIEASSKSNLTFVIIFFAPWMLSFAWFMQALGAYVDGMRMKRDPFAEQ